MYLGDNLIHESLAEFSHTFKENALDALILLRSVENPTAFGVAKVDARGKVLSLVEKPQTPPSDLALVGVYFFSSAIHDIIATLKPSARGELEITDAIQGLIDSQKAVEARQLHDWWLDTGKKDDLLEANRIILDAWPTICRMEGNLDGNSQVIGRVSVGQGTRIINSVVRGPVTIGQHCIIENAFIGPYSSLADNVLLKNVEIDHSVLLQGAEVADIQQRIVDSVIGQRARLTAAPPRPKALRFMIGDDSQVELV